MTNFQLSVDGKDIEAQIAAAIANEPQFGGGAAEPERADVHLIDERRQRRTDNP